MKETHVYVSGSKYSGDAHIDEDIGTYKLSLKWHLTSLDYHSTPPSLTVLLGSA